MRKLSGGVKTGIAVGLLILIIVGAFFGFVGHVLKRKPHEMTSAGGGGVTGVWQLVTNPREGFPDKDKIVILCMGIDDNWTDRDEVYTKGARTDTLFVLTLDLVKKSATMLSIPRDTYAHIAGTNWTFKINAAYGVGGPQRTIATVQELLGIHPDYYMVLNIDATKKMVDALGGVDVDVLHEMHYHDKWGHLSIDLMPGNQHLNGEQAVGFARYRHGDAGAKPSPEDGDDKRMARQHVLMRAMVEKGKTFGSVLQAPHLIDTAMQSIQTDMTRNQLADLVQIFHGIQPDEIQAGSLPGDDFRDDKGAWFYRIDPNIAREYVSWLVDGNQDAAKQIVLVRVGNATKVTGAAATAVDALKAAGFTRAEITLSKTLPEAQPDMPTVKLATSGSVPSSTTHINDSGVEYSGAAEAIAASLGINNPIITHIRQKPNRAGWTPAPAITVVLGSDYAAGAKPVSPPSAS